MATKRFIVMGICFAGLAWTGGTTLAQSEKAIPCAIDLVLRTGAVVDSTMFLHPILLLDEEQSTETISVYTVRGTGFYSLPGSTGTDGRMVIVEGRWSSAIVDIDRYIEVRVLSGPLKDRSYQLFVGKTFAGNISDSVWIELADGNPSGPMNGTTDCVSN